MRRAHFHVTYCGNIHAGESWADTRAHLRQYAPAIKARISPQSPFGLGLRLSKQAATELLQGQELPLFKRWLQENDLYVFTINGFPFGTFHDVVLKDGVHKPDWTEATRLEYTRQLFEILAYLLPAHLEGGVSTSPLSYKPWFADKPESLPEVFQKATENLLKMLERLMEIEENTGKLLHLDLEPEPDGLLENTEEVLHYFEAYLVPAAQEFLSHTHALAPLEAENTLKQHIRICYDACHFALAYEKPEAALAQFHRAGIQIGKFQISTALKVNWKVDPADQAAIRQALETFIEPTYLHQVIAQKADGTLQQFTDLPPALAAFDGAGQEWRIHFHVPVFQEKFPPLASTQPELLALLAQLVQATEHTHYLEIETYTWQVLPSEWQLPLEASIVRELEWLLKVLNL
ncbi:MAG: metabolite traffic protein EboE [Microscillaceae bacterium]